MFYVDAVTGRVNAAAAIVRWFPWLAGCGLACVFSAARSGPVFPSPSSARVPVRGPRTDGAAVRDRVEWRAAEGEDYPGGRSTGSAHCESRKARPRSPHPDRSGRARSPAGLTDCHAASPAVTARRRGGANPAALRSPRLAMETNARRDPDRPHRAEQTIPEPQTSPVRQRWLRGWCSTGLFKPYSVAFRRTALSALSALALVGMFAAPAGAQHYVLFPVGNQPASPRNEVAFPSGVSTGTYEIRLGRRGTPELLSPSALLLEATFSDDKTKITIEPQAGVSLDDFARVYGASAAVGTDVTLEGAVLNTDTSSYLNEFTLGVRYDASAVFENAMRIEKSQRWKRTPEIAIYEGATFDPAAAFKWWALGGGRRDWKTGDPVMAYICEVASENISFTPWPPEPGEDSTAFLISPGTTSTNRGAVQLTFKVAPDFDTGDELYMIRVSNGHLLNDIAGEGERTGCTGSALELTVRVKDAGPPAPVQNLAGALNNTGTMISVTWEPPAGFLDGMDVVPFDPDRRSGTESPGTAVSGYDYQHRTGTNPWTEGTTVGPEFTISGVNAGVSYEVEVRARNGEGAGAWSTLTLDGAGTAASAPLNLSATAAGDTQINLSWTTPALNGGSPISGYRIEVSSDGGTIWTDLVADTRNTSTTYAHTDLTVDDTRHYRVRAINAIGTSLPSNVDSATPRSIPTRTATVPDAPTGLSATADGSTLINLSWTAPARNGGSAISGYKIEVSSDGGTTWTDLVADTRNTSTTYAHTDLTVDDTRHYRARAINAIGTSLPSNVDSTATVPDAPTGLSATADGSTRINLSWTAPGNDGGSAISGYKIEVSSDGGTNRTDLVADTRNTSTTYGHTGLTAGVTHHYRVSAINAVGTGAPSTEATGAIETKPKAWIARYGRTVATHVADAVGERLREPAGQESHVTVGGYRLPLRRPAPGLSGAGAEQAEAKADEADTREGLEALAGWLTGKSGEKANGRAFESRTLTGREALAGSTFALTGGAAERGFGTLWGRGAVTRFDGRDGALSVDSEVASSMLGADWTQSQVLAGFVLSHSRGEGGYRDGSGTSAVESTLTALVPYARYEMSERVSVWGMAGHGKGTLTLTPEGQAPMRADIDLLMGAAGVRGVLVDGGAGGPTLAAESDAMAVRTSTGAVTGLAASEADVTRLRLALEGSQPFKLGADAVLTPSLDLGVRLDGGDAETGFGADIGAGLVLAAPSRGLSAEIRARGLLAHRAGGMRERGISGMLTWDPAPDSDRGLSLSLSQTVGSQAAGGADALLARPTLAGIGAEEDEGQLGRSLEARLGYGFGVFDDGWTATPEFGLSDTGRELHLGARLTETAAVGLALDLGVEATRRESEHGAATPQHGLGVGLGWRLAGARASHSAFRIRLEAARLKAANDNASPENRIGLELTARW